MRWKKHIYTSCSVAETKVLSFFIWKSQYCVEKVQWWWLWLSQGWRVQGRSTEPKREIIATEKLEASPLVILPRIIKGHHEFSWIVVFFLNDCNLSVKCEDHEPQWIERWAANRREGQDTQAVDSWDFWQTLGQSGIWLQRLVRTTWIGSSGLSTPPASMRFSWREPWISVKWGDLWKAVGCK